MFACSLHMSFSLPKLRNWLSDYKQYCARKELFLTEFVLNTTCWNISFQIHSFAIGRLVCTVIFYITAFKCVGKITLLYCFCEVSIASFDLHCPLAILWKNQKRIYIYSMKSMYDSGKMSTCCKMLNKIFLGWYSLFLNFIIYLSVYRVQQK